MTWIPRNECCQQTFSTKHPPFLVSHDKRVSLLILKVSWCLLCYVIPSNFHYEIETHPSSFASVVIFHLLVKQKSETNAVDRHSIGTVTLFMVSNDNEWSLPMLKVSSCLLCYVTWSNFRYRIETHPSSFHTFVTFHFTAKEKLATNAVNRHSVQNGPCFYWWVMTKKDPYSFC